MDTAKSPEKVLPLPPYITYILISLLKGERHAYRLLLDLRKALEGKTVIGTTTLYRTIDRMVTEGFIVVSDKRPDPSLDDERRVYYRITNFGTDVLYAEIARMESVVQKVRLLDEDCNETRVGQLEKRDEQEHHDDSDWPGAWLEIPKKPKDNPKTETGAPKHPTAQKRRSEN